MKAGNLNYTSVQEIPSIVPVFPLTGALLLPGGQLPLNIFEPRYLQMVNDAFASDHLIGMIQPCLKAGSRQENTDNPDLCTTGCLGRLTAFQETGDHRYLISLSGVCRFEVVEEIPSNASYRKCRIKPFESDLKNCDRGENVDRQGLICAFRNFLQANNMDADWETVEKADNESLLTALCMMSPYGPAEKQALLEAPDLKSRAETLIAISEIHLAQNSDDGIHLQ